MSHVLPCWQIEMIQNMIVTLKKKRMLRARSGCWYALHQCTNHVPFPSCCLQSVYDAKDTAIDGSGAVTNNSALMDVEVAISLCV